MEEKKCSGSQSRDGIDDVEDVTAKYLEQKPTIGDVIWIKLPRSLWWPVVVVGSQFSKNNKPGDRITGKVHVRIYGSNTHMYVDPLKWHSEFQIILKQNNGSYHEVFRKSLEQDQSRSKSSQKKRKASESKDVEELKKQKKLEKNSSSAKAKTKPSKEGGKEKQYKTPKKNSHDTPTSDGALPGRSQELSARRTKVMQSLGLIAPSGSPFHKIDALI